VQINKETFDTKNILPLRKYRHFRVTLYCR